MKKEKIIIYQVLPRLFGNNVENPTSNGSIHENGCGKFSDFTEEILKEIKGMGFNHIWYTGVIEHATQTDYSSWGIRKNHSAIVKGKAGSPYAIKDYYDIDPDLADNVETRMEEFETLIKRTHKAGLKVIMDFIPNHVAREYFSDAKPSNIEDLGIEDNIHVTFDPNNNFYYIPGQPFQPSFSLESDGEVYEEYPAKVTGNDCFNPNPGCSDWYETIKLNYGIDFPNGWKNYFSPIPETWKKMTEILLFWAGKKVDGFRCDMAEMVPVEFWNWAIPIVKEKFPGVIFIAEIYNPQQYRNYLDNGNFDYLYDKVGLYDTLKAVIRHEQPARNITYCWQKVNDYQLCMLNFLENHDEQRIASDFFAKDPTKALPALIVASMMNGCPFMVYFGQELGEAGMDEEGFSGKDGRTTIFDYWSIPSIRNWRSNEELLSEEQKKLKDYYVKILKLCNKSQAITQGVFYDLMYVNSAKHDFNSERQYAFVRYFENELLLIVANFENHPVDVNVFLPQHLFDYCEIWEKEVKSAKDLNSGNKYSSNLLPNSDYKVHVDANDAAIIRFLLK